MQRTLAETPVVADAVPDTQPLPTVAAPNHFGTAEKAVFDAGLLQERPQLQPGDVASISDYLVQPTQLLSHYPRAYHWPAFISNEQAQHLVKVAEGHMQPSQLVLKEGDSEDNYKYATAQPEYVTAPTPTNDHRGVRTSEGAFFTRDQDPLFALVEDKIAALTGVPVDHGEVRGCM